MINKAWHEAHKMPARATHEERVAWHVAHARACGCRKPPTSVAAEVKRELAKKR